ncbi:MAG: hypothetical protein N3C12_05405 [Candidatus Binatia bacterium]|nr:hypothetical protein [Candidatus Binatia bacterium]
MKIKFALRFIAAFTLLLATWASAGFGTAYRTAALELARLVSPALTGWWLEFGATDRSNPVFTKGGVEIPLQIDVSLLSMAQVPLQALICATPGLGLVGTVGRCVIGMVAFFLVHVLVLLIYPVVLAHPSWWTDTLGVFSGLLSFVLAPQLLWFILTYPRLKELWHLGSVSAPAATGTKGLAS